MRTDAVDNPLRLAEPVYLRQSRLFAHDEWRMVESVVLNAGAMFENDGMGHRNTSPRVALNYHFMPQQTLRVSTSVAYRSPATLEENADQPGYLLALGGVKPEKIHSKEVGYLGEFNATGVSVDARVYYDEVSDIVYYDPSPIGPPAFDGTPYSFNNLLSATYRGFEGTIKYHWEESSNLILNYSRQSASCSVTGTLREPLFQPILQGVADACSTMVPWNSGSILLTQQMSHDVLLSAGYYYQEELQFIDTPAPLSTMRRLDLRLAQTFGKPDASGGEVALVVQNALQDSYNEYGAVTQTAGTIFFGRRVWLAATLRF
jgi:iron complex outermembrane receptor protein